MRNDAIVFVENSFKMVKIGSAMEGTIEIKQSFPPAEGVHHAYALGLYKRAK